MKTNNNSIAFIYPSYYPVKGGASVHGYNLAKGLSDLGYVLKTFNKQPDGFSENNPKTLWCVIKTILKADIVYIRVHLEGKTLLLAKLAKLLGKKVVVELNGLSDEYAITRNYNQEQIQAIDKKLSNVLQKVNAVITVSDIMKQHVQQTLGVKKAFAIHNGGELFIEDNLDIDESYIKQFAAFKQKHKTIAIWSGSNYPWQGFKQLYSLIKRLEGFGVGFVIISNDVAVLKQIKQFSHVFAVSNLTREYVQYLMLQSDLGLALYGDFSWSRKGVFHGSSLKYYEYLINELWVIATPIGHMKEDNYPNLLLSDDVDEMVSFLKTLPLKPDLSKVKFRDWQMVANETATIINTVLNEK